MSDRLTYSQRIYLALHLAEGSWVSALRLVEEGGLNYRRRISDLREQGHVIENKIEMAGNVKHSFYRLKP